VQLRDLQGLDVHGFLHACAALRGRMRHGGNLIGDGVLRVTGMGPG
jgi:hypothetical protein